MSNIENTVNKIVREEMARMVNEAKEKAPDIQKKLEEMRKKLFPEMSKTEGLVDAGRHIRAERRIELTNCADILGIKVNELALHLLNNVKTQNDRTLVEFRLGQVIFYAD